MKKENQLCAKDVPNFTINHRQAKLEKKAYANSPTIHPYPYKSPKYKLCLAKVPLFHYQPIEVITGQSYVGIDKAKVQYCTMAL